MSSLLPVDIPQSSMVGQQRQQISELEFDKLLTPRSVFCWKTRFRSQVTTCSVFFCRRPCYGSKKWRWSNQCMNFNARDQLQARNSRILNCWTRGLLLLEQDHPELSLRNEVSLEELKAQKEDRFLRGRQIAFMIYDYLRVTAARDTELTLRVIMFRNSIQDGKKILLSMTKIPSDDVLEGLYKLRIRESDQLRTVLELYYMEIHQKMSMPNFQKLRTVVKRGKDQKLRLRDFDARHRKIETGAVVKSRRV